MDIEELKCWIKDNICYKRGLICKKCNRLWFFKYNLENIWDSILEHTKFLDFLNPTFPQRIWHILNDKNIIRCSNSNCQNTPSFFSFNKGYLKSCCPRCAQFDLETINKIKSTNIRKYGTEYGLSNRDIINKRINTNLKKYGVDNVSKLPEISIKKRETCKKNYGTEWFLNRQDLKKQFVFEKYGVDNIQKVKEISEKNGKMKMNVFYDTLNSSDRFKNRVRLVCSKEDYNGTGKFYDFECLTCKTIFSYQLRWDRIPRCPTCYPGVSQFEKDILDFIKEKLPNETIDVNNKNILPDKLELDIYIPNKKLAIECDGLYWHGEVGGSKNKNYHLNKTINCEQVGIRLIHIFEDEWKNKQNIIKQKLENILLINSNKIYARNCTTEVITNSSIKSEFLNKTHIQGNDSSSIWLGLYTKEDFPKLVAMMTFGRCRITIGGNKNKDASEFELIRYSSSTHVIGGAGKLLSHFIKTYKPSKIISYADRRWSCGNLYEKLGFTKISNGTPNYWYFGRGSSYKRYHRFGFAKHTLSKKLEIFDPELTEWENMQLNGWDRIWDCGHLKYEFTC